MLHRPYGTVSVLSPKHIILEAPLKTEPYLNAPTDPPLSSATHQDSGAEPELSPTSQLTSPLTNIDKQTKRRRGHLNRSRNKKRDVKSGQHVDRSKKNGIQGQALHLKLQAPFNQESIQDEQGSVCLLSSTHYIVSGTIGLHPRLMHMAFDTGCVPNVIRRSALPQGWENSLLKDQDFPALGDANGNPLKLMGKIVLRVRLGSATYLVLFVVAEHLAVSVIIGTSFMNRNVKGIMCMEQWIYLTRSKVPILAQHQGLRQVSEGGNHESQTPSVQERKQRAMESNLNAPNTVRLAKNVTILPLSQVAVPVTTQASALVFIEPNHALKARHHVRTANGIVEVRKNEKFMIVLSNFSKTSRKLPKNMVIAYATRNPLGIFTLDNKTSERFEKVLNVPFTRKEEDVHEAQDQVTPEGTDKTTGAV